MDRNRFRLTVALGCATALAGCNGGGGDGGFGGESLPTADNTVPGLYDALGPGGVDDYFASVAGTWLVNLDGQVNTTITGTAVLADAMIYDSALDQWTVNIDGTNFVLTDPTNIDFYGSDGCSTNCVFLEIFDDDPAVGQWGTFGYANNINVTNLANLRLPLFFTHYGLKTVNMPPAGASATYNNNNAGAFQGEVVREIGPGSFEIDGITGSVDITANFTAGGGTVTFNSSGTGAANANPPSYNLTGTATISGNTYAGTVSGDYSLDGVNPTVSFVTSGSTLSGAFYGPNQTGGGETAGVVYASDSAGTGEIVGGFWAPQEGYSPP